MHPQKNHSPSLPIEAGKGNGGQQKTVAHPTKIQS